MSKKAINKRPKKAVIEIAETVEISDNVQPTKKLDGRFIRISMEEKAEKFKEFGRRVNEGELKWAYYAIDGNIGYQYYLILKK